MGGGELLRETDSSLMRGRMLGLGRPAEVRLDDDLQCGLTLILRGQPRIQGREWEAQPDAPQDHDGPQIGDRDQDDQSQRKQLKPQRHRDLRGDGSP